MYKRKIVSGLMVILLIAVFLIAIPQPTKSARLVLDKSFTPSAITYSNKTMHFQTGDPYNGYAYWTYDVGSTVNGPSDNQYYLGTDTNGEYAYFGFDEFVNHSIVRAEVIFETTAITGTYHFQPLGYFYQKTALESNTHWALVVNWDSSGIDLIHNTGNGDTPTSVNLVGTAPNIGEDYRIILRNYGESTFVGVYNLTYGAEPIIYSGYTTTINYDATVLYAGFGQYSTGSGDITGRWDDLSIVDTILSYPSDGTGLYTIDAYIDEVFTHTFYDVDEGRNSSLDIDTTVSNITLSVQCWLNGTAYGVSTVAEGRNIIRHNVTVSIYNGTIVFSQSNFTYLFGIDYGNELFLYQYSVELDFTPISGYVYTVVVNYETYH